MRTFRLALALMAVGSVSCDESVPPATPRPAPNASTPAPTSTPVPAARPTLAPLATIRQESVTFDSGALEALGGSFDLRARGPVEVAVGCHQSFTPFQLTKVDLFSGAARLASQRCGPASPTCTDIGLALELEAGSYVVRLERDASHRGFTGYMCDITVRAQP